MILMQTKCDLCGATSPLQPLDGEGSGRVDFAEVSIRLPRKIRSDAAAQMLDRVSQLGPVAETYMEGVADSFYLEDFRVSLHVCDACQEGRLWEAVEAQWKATTEGEEVGPTAAALRAVDSGERRSWEDDTFLLQLRRESTRIVLFVEDADLVLRDRDQNLHGLAPLSTFLNATEGMLADVLDLRLVVTTNAEADAQLDAAVTRPGRLHTMVRVDELSQVSATRALRVLVPGADAPGRAMPLADVYAAARDLGWTPPKSAREVPRRVPDRSGIVGEFEEA